MTTADLPFAGGVCRGNAASPVRGLEQDEGLDEFLGMAML